MAIKTETALIFITLLYLVVVELSSTVRSVELFHRREIENRPIFGFLPNLGKFSYVHIINSFILMSGYLIVYSNWLSNDNVAITIVLILTAALLFFLPYLELNDYDIIERQAEARFDSRAYHNIFSFLVVVGEPVLFVISGYVVAFLNIPILVLINAVIFTLVYFWAMDRFLSQVEIEIGDPDVSNEIKRTIDAISE